MSFLCFYKCTWCDEKFEGAINLESVPDDAVTSNVLAWLQADRPVAFHLCHPNDGSERHGIAHLVGVRKVR